MGIAAFFVRVVLAAVFLGIADFLGAAIFFVAGLAADCLTERTFLGEALEAFLAAAIFFIGAFLAFLVTGDFLVDASGVAISMTGDAFFSSTTAFLAMVFIVAAFFVGDFLPADFLAIVGRFDPAILTIGEADFLVAVVALGFLDAATDFLGEAIFLGVIFLEVIFLDAVFLAAVFLAAFLGDDFLATTESFLVAVFLAMGIATASALVSMGATTWAASLMALRGAIFLAIKVFLAEATFFLGEAAFFLGEAAFLGEAVFLGEEDVLAGEAAFLGEDIFCGIKGSTPAAPREKRLLLFISSPSLTAALISCCTMATLTCLPN